MRKLYRTLIRVSRRRAVALWLALLASPAGAENLALVLSRGEGASGFLHSELTAAYAEAGFTVMGGFDLSGPATTDLLQRFEAAAPGAQHLVIHLTRGLRDAGGIAVFVPEGLADDSLTGLLTGGVPLPLFLGIAAARPGQSMVALGGWPTGAPVPGAADTLVVAGPAEAVATVVLTRMLKDGLAAGQIDTAGSEVVFAGLISDTLRLGQSDTVATAPAAPDTAGETATGPADAEAALALDFAGREAVQRALAELGRYDGPADGTIGPATRAALRDWQVSAGFQPTGYLDPATLDALQSAAAASIAARAMAEAERNAWDAARTVDTVEALRGYLDTYPDGRFAARARDRLDTLEGAAEQAQRIAAYRAEEQALGLTLASVATIERRLRDLGLDPGLADGRIEIDTRRAIARFQAEMGLTPTGYLSSITLQRLIIASR